MNWRHRKKANDTRKARESAIDRLKAILEDPGTAPELILSATRQLERILGRAERAESKKPVSPGPGVNLTEAREKPWLFDWQDGQPISRRTPEQLEEIDQRLRERGL